jgi:Lon protease-like protein
MSDEANALEDFKGLARLFPLPNLVLFPCVVQGLHIFEPRYRQMAADALADDRLLAVVLLRPGWESDYQGRPKLHPVGCLGRIVADEPLADGRYNLHLRGLSRVRLLEEVEAGTAYRNARVELLPDVNVVDAAVEADLRRRLVKAASLWCPAREPAASAFRNLLESTLPLGVVCDVLSAALPVDLHARQDLLERGEVAGRVSRLAELLEGRPPPSAVQKFPPDFSSN